MGFPFFPGWFEKGTFSQMSQLNQRDFDQFGNTPDYEIENLIASNWISPESDITCLNSLTYILLEGIERDVISLHEITVLFSTLKI